VITVLLCVQLMLACGKPHDYKSAQLPDGTNGSQHKVVQVDWRAQLADIQKRLKEDPNSPFLHNQAAVAYDALGDFDNFDREIHLAMKLEPENSINYYMAYGVYKRRHLRDKQISVLEKALQIDPDNPIGHYEKAAIFEDDKKWADALTEYQTTKTLLERVKSDPDNFRNNSWTYRDGNGNIDDVSWVVIHIDRDINRVRASTQVQK
jgi:tetratricopeptide (TPR) repeat protein